MNPEVSKLPQKWREILQNGYSGAASRELERCADELEVALSADREGEAKDAARYRWLRSDDRKPSNMGLWVAMGSFACGIGQWTGKLLDDVVDAAIAASQKGEGSRD